MVSRSPIPHFLPKNLKAKNCNALKVADAFFNHYNFLFPGCSSEISSFHRCSKCLDLGGGGKGFFIPSFPLSFATFQSLDSKISSFVKASKRVSYAVLSAKPFCYLKYRPRQLFSLVISISIFRNDSIKVFRCNVIKTDK